MRHTVIALLTATLLSACGGDKAPTSEQNTTTAPEAPVAGQDSASDVASNEEAPPATANDNAAKAQPGEDGVASNPLRDAYFGETHLHTGVSMDAFIGGNRLTPDDAYRFARGEEVKVNGSMHKIKRPLDFCAVTDHAEFIGETYTLMTPGAPGYDDPLAKKFRDVTDLKEALGLYNQYVLTPLATGKDPHPPFFQGVESIKSSWKKNFEATQKHYVPGKFTTIHAYEWTSAPGGANLHRNVLFRDTNVPEVPFSANDGADPQELWKWMQAQRSEGMKVFAIPHNANESKGRDFPETTLDGKPITKSYVETRASMEPLIEMMQVKGNSEVVPDFWPNDEFADFENARTLQDYNDRKFMKQNFVRYGLTRGLKYQEEFGTNPFKYGFVGGTDNHNGAPSNVAEDNYKVGSHGLVDRTAKDRAKNTLEGEMRVADTNPGAITGVWATSNTRGAIWDAMQARETFATSGPRMKVRAFAGQGFASTYDSYEAMVKDGYAKGVPMGGDYSGETAPQIMVWAVKDPIGPNLDRIQIVKGWLEDGEMKDTIYNVVASGDRLQEDGSVAPIDAPIDMKTGEFNKEKGSPELMAVWTDPDYDPSQKAYYYVRVLQLPTARWSLFDELREGVKFPEDTKMQIVERAWGSPIWYTPE
ncbi:DUF3604 domain-containing protein [Microbulbifer hydrolyticus]|uniref:DUF3604 domain-containing protein n=1 Tax=Microbulbifer hydrolyticus TaxID=48074 RepID=A0A6P1T914_9GAMM|nr:DUF3604 domain-containing protein [Microbulbifer hydrolyticus]MBB5210962.1 hypothetical protein [Microbulbifer hydrolyticus]QHQ38225.1 DUF3604 domain-containing protein [Microbulbifer hydrolyticus]